MQKMIYKKNLNADPEIVMMINAYCGTDGKFKALIVRDYKKFTQFAECPYVEVKLNTLRPVDEDYDSIFH